MKATTVFEKTWEAINATNSDGTRKYKYIIHTGSSRSSKTYSILQSHWLRCLTVPNTRVSIWRETKADCKMTILADLKKAVVTFPDFDKVVFNKTESIYTFPNGSTIEFMGGDEENRVHGFQGNVAHLNEPYQFKLEAFNQIDMRTSDYIIIDWNPKIRHFIDDISKMDNAIVIHSTWKDNPFVPEQQRLKIESYLPIKYCEVVESGLLNETEAKIYNFEDNRLNLTTKQINELKKAIYNEEQHTSDDYMHVVYSKGMKAEKPHKIYRGWQPITLEQYNAVKEREYFGLDYGWANPSALVGIKYDGDRTIYVRPALYKAMNDMKAPDGTPIPLGEYLLEAGFPQGNITYCWADSSDKEAGSEISLTNHLRERYKLNIIPTKKPTYKTRWEFISKLRVFYVQDDNFEFEYDNYELEFINGSPTGKPIKKNDHCFVGETLIDTNKGKVMIKDIKVGDLVLTSQGYRKVLKVWDNGVKTTTKYKISTNKGCYTLHCTHDHKIKTNIGWLEIQHLKKGNSIFISKTLFSEQDLFLSNLNRLNLSPRNIKEFNDVKVEVKSIDIVQLDYNNVYDLTIDEYHEYFANGVLVHNCMNALEYGVMGVKDTLEIKI